MDTEFKGSLGLRCRLAVDPRFRVLAIESNCAFGMRLLWQETVPSDYQKQLWARWGWQRLLELFLEASVPQKNSICFVLLLLPPMIKLIAAFILFSVLCCLFHLVKPHPAFKANFKLTPRSASPCLGEPSSQMLAELGRRSQSRQAVYEGAKVQALDSDLE